MLCTLLVNFLVAVSASPSAGFKPGGSFGDLDRISPQHNYFGTPSFGSKKSSSNYRGIPSYPTNSYNRGILTMLGGFPFTTRSSEFLGNAPLGSSYSGQYPQQNSFETYKSVFDPSDLHYSSNPHYDMPNPYFDSFETHSFTYPPKSNVYPNSEDNKSDQLVSLKHRKSSFESSLLDDRTSSLLKEQTEGPVKSQNLRLTFLGFLPQSSFTTAPQSFKSKESTYNFENSFRDEIPFYPLNLNDGSDYDSEGRGSPSVLVSPYRIKPDLPDQGMFGTYRPTYHDLSPTAPYSTGTVNPQTKPGSNLKPSISAWNAEETPSQNEYNDSPTRLDLMFGRPDQSEAKITQRTENGYYLIDVKPIHRL